MTLHLAEISAAVAPGAHAVLLLDQAGWHNSRALDIPDNITLLPIPPTCPELNPVENVCSSCATTGSRTGCSPPTRSEEHTSELQSLMHISYAVCCLHKKTTT